MNAFTPQFDPEGVILLLEINVPPEIEAGFPEANFIGAILLHMALRNTLEADGLLIDRIGTQGPLNKSLYGFKVVSDWKIAARKIMDVLRRAGLNHAARLYRFDPDEGVTRCLTPGGADVADVNDLFKKYGVARAPSANGANEFPTQPLYPES